MYCFFRTTSVVGSLDSQCPRFPRKAPINVSNMTRPESHSSFRVRSMQAKISSLLKITTLVLEGSFCQQRQVTDKFRVQEILESGINFKLKSGSARMIDVRIDGHCAYLILEDELDQAIEVTQRDYEMHLESRGDTSKQWRTKVRELRRIVKIYINRSAV